MHNKIVLETYPKRIHEKRNELFDNKRKIELMKKTMKNKEEEALFIVTQMKDEQGKTIHSNDNLRKKAQKDFLAVDTEYNELKNVLDAEELKAVRAEIDLEFDVNVFRAAIALSRIEGGE
jgi:hypothetical protein